MKMGSATCLKYCNIVLCFLFVLASLALIVCGSIAAFVFLLVGSTDTLQMNIASPSLLIVLCGVILFLAILFGCCAFCTDNTCLLITYTVFLVLLCIAQFAISGYMLYNYQESNEELRKQINIDVEMLLESYQDGRQNTLDVLQENLKCCGVSRPHNYNVKIYPDHKLPASCCEHYSVPCNIASKNKFDDGCAETFFNTVVHVNQSIAVLSIAVGILELLGAIIIQSYLLC